MYKLLGVLMASFAFTGVLAIPFIGLLYKIKFRYRLARSTKREGARLSDLHKDKAGTPTGGGILIVTAAILFALLFYLVTKFQINWTAVVLFVTMVLFAGLGLLDDARKMIRIRGRRIRALPRLPKLILQITCGLVVAFLLYDKLGLHTLTVPLFSQVFDLAPLDLGVLYIPFAAFVVISSSNAFNITDGLDGLATGLLLIALSAFWVLAGNSVFAGDVTLFIAVIMGSLLAFLYFNIFPARLFMGDTGSLALGAMLAVLALVVDQVLVLPIIGGMFVIELLSSFLQIASKRLRDGKRLFDIAPLHFHFQARGWDETKVTMRFWLFGAMLAFLGIFISIFGK
ncbi:phospho-N-acetylmuramoyl-pentapeptide-transferase [candidate division WWE3 bacterium]|uniref:Phospho-N-acetylmuramoyl-pentapeptide-transferase n=1 Tax=candidate division WWE3 bacterium TaxID=2053526 RepID=A0A955LKU2_UNCKA|nr:phospho-N-acetylmuramoyl-pentapeptide-transferase [candidate division WWE3 bacterium]